MQLKIRSTVALNDTIIHVFVLTRKLSIINNKKVQRIANFQNSYSDVVSRVTICKKKIYRLKHTKSYTITISAPEYIEVN